MKIEYQSSDASLLGEIGARVAAVRLERNLTQAVLAKEAGVSKRTVERLESGQVGTRLAGFLRVCRVLGLLERFEQLIPAPSPSPMALLKLHGRQRQRASGMRVSEPPPPNWSWGE